ncbi:MAG: TrmB family transcriptional regulator [Promethearchaeota archaeon]
MTKDMLDTLRIIGLTEYETKVYLTLISANHLTASELSERSGVPYSRVYNVISVLKEKGWVEIEEGRPIRIFARNPEITIGKAMKRINERMMNTYQQLNSLFVSKPRLDRAIILTINGWSNTLEILSEMLNSARREVMLMFGFLSIHEKQMLSEALSNLMKKGIRIRGIARRESDLTYEVEELEKFCEVHYMIQAPSFRMTIVDWKTALIAFPQIEGDTFNYDDVTALRLSHPAFLSLVRNTVPTLWEDVGHEFEYGES